MGLCSGKRFEIEDKLARGAFFEHAADVRVARTVHGCVQSIGANVPKDVAISGPAELLCEISSA